MCSCRDERLCCTWMGQREMSFSKIAPLRFWMMRRTVALTETDSDSSDDEL